MKNARLSKEEKIARVLRCVVEYWLRTGKPVGSNTLKEEGVEGVSSASIRNYCTELEERGFLQQLHTSSGRIPTPLALRQYLETLFVTPRPFELPSLDPHELGSFFSSVVSSLAKDLQLATIVSLPRLEQDHIREIRAICLDSQRALFCLITRFGQIKTEIVTVASGPQHLSALEKYLNQRLLGDVETPRIEFEQVYQELMLRFLVETNALAQAHFVRYGLSYLAQQIYPEEIAHALNLVESPHILRFLWKKALKTKAVVSFLGPELEALHIRAQRVAVFAAPYSFQNTPCGIVCVVAPLRIDYEHVLASLQGLCKAISEQMTRSMAAQQIVLVPPQDLYLEQAQPNLLLDEPNPLLQISWGKTKDPTHES